MENKKTYTAEIEIDEKEIQEIFDRLGAAKEEIYNCYSQLRNLGIVKIQGSSSKVG